MKFLDKFDLNFPIAQADGDFATVQDEGIASGTVDPLGFGYHIGARNISSGTGFNYLEVLIDDIRIYNKVLTDTEIQNLYSEGGW